MRSLLVASCAVAWFGCQDDTYLVVTVERRPAVHDVASLHVTLSNSGSMRSDDLELDGDDFPLTFAITAPGRSGDLGISIDALASDGALTGRGSGSTTLADAEASVLLDTADFVVNTNFANNQFLSNDFEAVGLQLAALTDDSWTVAYRDEPCTGCSVFARRFDATGVPLASAIAAGTNEFPLTTTLTTSGAIPALAGSGLTTLAIWDFLETVGAVQGVACRALNEQGNATPMQTTLSSDAADVVTISPMANGNFVATWQAFMTTSVVRSLIVRPDCVALTAPITISTGAIDANRSHAASNGASILYAWIVAGEVHARVASNVGALMGVELVPVTKTATQQIEHVRVVPWGTGYALAVRWASTIATDPGKIEVYRLNAAGMVVGPPTVVTDKSASDFASKKAFGLARRDDDALMVVWHVCETGPGSCDVLGRILRPTGVPVGDPIVLPTSSGSDQVNPSVTALSEAFVAAWNDSSGIDPDRSGSAVRARLLYPPYDDARAVLGAPCGGDIVERCGPGLVCAMGSDAMQRCYAACSSVCLGGGTCSAIDASTSVCMF